MLLNSETEIARAKCRFTRNGDAILYSFEGGTVPAGSRTRVDAPCYGVAFMLDNARHGRKFAKTDEGLAKAKAYMENVAFVDFVNV